MKKYKLAIYIILLILASYNFSFAFDIKITDGDTITLKGEKIRFFGIDAPEMKQICEKNGEKIFCGKLSKIELGKKIGNKKVKCEKKGVDNYKRTLAKCFVEGESLSKYMVRNGYAFAFVRYSKIYIEDEKYAKNNKLGFWTTKFEYPWEWRKKNK